MPFGNEVDLITVKGSTLFKAFERSVENWDPVEQSGAFLQISGMYTHILFYTPRRRALLMGMFWTERCRWLRFYPLFAQIQIHVFSLFTVFHPVIFVCSEYEKTICVQGKFGSFEVWFT